MQNQTSIDDRIITEINFGRHNHMIVGVYEDATLQEKENLIEQLTDVLQSIGNRKEIYLMDDVNARVTNKQKNSAVEPCGENTRHNNRKCSKNM